MHKLGTVIKAFGSEKNIPFESIEDQSLWVLVNQHDQLPVKINFHLKGNSLFMRSGFTFESWRMDEVSLLEYANYLNELTFLGKFLVKTSEEQIENRITNFIFSVRLDAMSDDVLKQHLPLLYSHSVAHYYYAVGYLLELINKRISMEEALEGFQKRVKEL